LIDLDEPVSKLSSNQNSNCSFYDDRDLPESASQLGRSTSVKSLSILPSELEINIISPSRSSITSRSKQMLSSRRSRASSRSLKQLQRRSTATIETQTDFTHVKPPSGFKDTPPFTHRPFSNADLISAKSKLTSVPSNITDTRCANGISMEVISLRDQLRNELVNKLQERSRTRHTVSTCEDESSWRRLQNQ